MKNIIMSLGGSMVVPDKIDLKFIKEFKKLILDFTNQGHKAAIICGGGKTCRIYQDAARELGCKDNDDLDWIGIRSTNLNAELVRSVFGEDAYEKVIDNPRDPIKSNKKIIIGSGHEPGHSTDMDAVLLAENIKADVVINLTNIDYVYDKDPKKHKGAKPLKEVTWKDYLEIIGEEWIPGRNTPFDPVASKQAMKLGKKVVIINGNDLKNIKNFLDGKEFIGTIIQ
ncbi:UMP kinase [Candidatus Woesearchaeota archaeon]|nr:UMP kinase [Candidatus Woesearchaeota archaeon]